MTLRSSLVFGIILLVLRSAYGGLVLQTAARPDPGAPRSDQQSADANRPRRAEGEPHQAAGLEQQKQLLGRLVKELQRSPRSFVFLRSAGFTESDQELERLIAANNALFRPVRIIRRDEQGNRQIPGWPGVALSAKFKSEAR